MPRNLGWEHHDQLGTIGCRGSSGGLEIVMPYFKVFLGSILHCILKSNRKNMAFLSFSLCFGFGTASVLFLPFFVVSGFLEGSKKFTELKIKWSKLLTPWFGWECIPPARVGRCL